MNSNNNCVTRQKKFKHLLYFNYVSLDQSYVNLFPLYVATKIGLGFFIGSSNTLTSMLYSPSEITGLSQRRAVDSAMPLF